MRRKIAQDVVNSGIAQIGNLCISFIVSVIIARSLGAESRGVLAAALLLPGITMALTFSGLMPPIIYFIAAGKWEHQQIFQRIWTLSTWVAIFGAFVIFVIYQFKSLIVEFVPEKFLWFSFLLLPLSLCEQVMKAVLTALRDYGTIKKIVLFQAVFQLLTIGLLCWLDAVTVFITLALQFSAILLGIVACCLEIRRLGIPIFVKYSLALEPVMPAIRYGLKSHGANLAQFFNYRLDQILITGFLGPVSLGVYTIALGLSEKLWVVTKDVAGVIFPAVSGSQEDENIEELTVFIGKVGLYATIALAAILAAAVIIFSETIYGDSYASLKLPFLILLPGVIALSLGRVLSNYLAGVGQPELGMCGAIFALLLNLPISLILTPQIGLAGAAVGTGVAHLASTFYICRAFSKRAKCSVFHLIIFNKSDFFSIKEAIMKIVDKFYSYKKLK